MHPKSSIVERLHFRLAPFHQMVEERPQRKKVDQLETGHKTEAQQQTEQSAKRGQDAEPVLCGILPVQRRHQIVKVHVNEALVFEYYVFAANTITNAVINYYYLNQI